MPSIEECVAEANALGGVYAIQDPIDTIVGPIGRFQAVPEALPLHPAMVGFGKRRTGKTFTFRDIFYNCLRDKPFGIVVTRTKMNGFWQVSLFTSKNAGWHKTARTNVFTIAKFLAAFVVQVRLPLQVIGIHTISVVAKVTSLITLKRILTLAHKEDVSSHHRDKGLVETLFSPVTISFWPQTCILFFTRALCCGGHHRTLESTFSASGSSPFAIHIQLLFRAHNEKFSLFRCVMGHNARIQGVGVCDAVSVRVINSPHVEIIVRHKLQCRTEQRQKNNVTLMLQLCHPAF